MSTIQEGTWLCGREMLVREIGGRVEAVRTSIERPGASRGFGAGLVVFLERRLNHLGEALAGLRQGPAPLAENRRQSLDRMVSAVVSTLLHVEFDLAVEPPGFERSFPVAQNKPVPEPKPEPGEQRQEWRKPRRRREPRTPVPAGNEDADSQADGAAGDAG